MSLWLLIVPTPSGPTPLAAVFSESGCELLVQLFAAAGAACSCLRYVPGVGA